MNRHSNPFKATTTSSNDDSMLEALRNQAGQENSFSASSAALQAANSVMLASMRARLGKAAPTPSVIHASAAAQAHAAEHSAIAVVATAEEPVASPSAAEEETHRSVKEDAETSVIEQAPAITDSSDDAAPLPVISPAAQRAERWDSTESEPISVAAPSFGRRSYQPEVESVTVDEARSPETAAIEPATTEQSATLDTEDYQHQTEATYRSWQSSLQPDERSWQKIAMIALVVIAVGVNLFFFFGSGPEAPYQPQKPTNPVAASITAPDAASKARGAILFPDRTPPAPDMEEANEATLRDGSAEPRNLEISSQLSLPNQHGAVPSHMPKAEIPTMDAEGFSPITPPAPKAAKAAPKAATTTAAEPLPKLNPQQLLRVLSRP